MRYINPGTTMNIPERAKLIMIAYAADKHPAVVFTNALRIMRVIEAHNVELDDINFHLDGTSIPCETRKKKRQNNTS